MVNSLEEFDRLSSEFPEILTRLMKDADGVAAGFGMPTGLSHVLMAFAASDGGARRIRGMGGDPAAIRSEISDTLRDAIGAGGLSGGNSAIQAFLRGCRERATELRCDPADTGMMDVYPNGIILGLIGRSAARCAVTEAGLVTGGLEHLVPEADEALEVGEILDILMGQEFPDLTGPEPFVHVEAGPPVIDAGRKRQEIRALWNEGAPRQPAPAGPARIIEEKKPPAEEPVRQATPKREAAGNSLADNPEEAVERAIRRLSDLARDGRIDPVHGRDAEIAHILSVIMRRKKSSIILHGDAGVGKTSIVEGLALALRQPGVDPDLAARPLYEISLSGLVAGSRFRGDFEGRVAEMIRRAMAERAILFIDEIHNIVGSGSGSGKTNDGANMLKPALARGDITIIGATTSREARVLRTDHALMRRFDMLHIREPSASEAREILNRSSWGYSAHHKIVAAPAALDEIIRIADAHIPDRRFPDKAFDLLDMGCVIARESSGTELCPDHVRSAAARLGVRLPGPPGEAVRRRMLALETAEFAPAETIEAISRATRSAWLRGARRGVMAAWGITAPSPARTKALAEGFAATMGLPLHVIDLGRIRDHSHIGLLTGYPGRSEATDSSGELVDAGDGAAENVLLLTGAAECHPAGLDIVAAMLRDGIVTSSDGRRVPMGGAWVIFDLRPPETRRIGFRNEDAAAISEAAARVLGQDILGQLTGSWELGAEAPADMPELDGILGDLRLHGLEVACAERIRSRIAEMVPANGRALFFRRLRERLCDDVIRHAMSGMAEIGIRRDEVVLIPS